MTCSDALDIVASLFVKDDFAKMKLVSLPIKKEDREEEKMPVPKQVRETAA